MLSREEVAGVIAHELAHIKNRDTLIMTITATIAGAISMLAQFGMFFGGNRDNNNGGMGIIGTLAMVILAPIAAMLVQMAISRTREYAADRLGAEISGSPHALASALAQDLERRARRSRTRPPSAIRRPRICSSSIRCRGAAHGQPVLDPSRDREPHRGAAASSRARWAGGARSAAAATASARALERRPRRGPWG